MSAGATASESFTLDAIADSAEKLRIACGQTAAEILVTLDSLDDRSPTNLSKSLGISPSIVSATLTRLKLRGMVLARREGQNRQYELTPLGSQAAACIRQFVDACQLAR